MRLVRQFIRSMSLVCFESRFVLRHRFVRSVSCECLESRLVLRRRFMRFVRRAHVVLIRVWPSEPSVFSVQVGLLLLRRGKRQIAIIYLVRSIIQQ